MNDRTTAVRFEEGLVAYYRGDYAVAFTLWLPLARDGHVQAMCNVGVMYACGNGVERDDVAAALYCRGAAEQGNATAQCNLGLMYANGLGVPRDTAEAVRWYRMAAEQHDRDAQFNLGLMFARGDTGTIDLPEAHVWFDLAASCGDPEALEGRRHVAKELTAAELAHARMRARERKTDH